MPPSNLLLHILRPGLHANPFGLKACLNRKQAEHISLFLVWTSNPLPSQRSYLSLRTLKEEMAFENWLHPTAGTLSQLLVSVQASWSSWSITSKEWVGDSLRTAPGPGALWLPCVRTATHVYLLLKLCCSIALSILHPSNISEYRNGQRLILQHLGGSVG